MSESVIIEQFETVQWYVCIFVNIMHHNELFDFLKNDSKCVHSLLVCKLLNKNKHIDSWKKNQVHQGWHKYRVTKYMPSPNICMIKSTH